MASGRTAADMRANARRALIEAIAEFLSDDVARKSIELQMGKPDAKAWAKISNIVGGNGYDSKELRIGQLAHILATP